jgi:hypothetical protein
MQAVLAATVSRDVRPGLLPPLFSKKPMMALAAEPAGGAVAWLPIAATLFSCCCCCCLLASAAVLAIPAAAAAAGSDGLPGPLVNDPRGCRSLCIRLIPACFSSAACFSRSSALYTIAVFSVAAVRFSKIAATTDTRCMSGPAAMLRCLLLCCTSRSRVYSPFRHITTFPSWCVDMLSSAHTASIPSLPSGVLISCGACSMGDVALSSSSSASHSLLPLLSPPPAPLYSLQDNIPGLPQLLRHVTGLPALDLAVAPAPAHDLPGLDSLLPNGAAAAAAASCSLPGLDGPLLLAPVLLLQPDMLRAKAVGELGLSQANGWGGCWLCCCSHAGSQLSGCCSASNGASSMSSGNAGT